MQKRITLFIGILINFIVFAQTPSGVWRSSVIIPEEIFQKFGFTEAQLKTDTEPQFPGGIHILRMTVADKIDLGNVKSSKDRLKTTLYFVIESDGKISDVISIGDNDDFNKEGERIIKSIKNIWTPAKLNGEPVRFIYALPLTMAFE
ncbi:energy transducer TonB [Chryseobacterium sp. JUb7]|uniref:energy transducer TonB n=1 Tax=Chryseobacterium sp. JUb7 TaxID=2940599 RepID=UPI002168906D|nr:energy transducer TonB [Chryseobacterium sp. JUb7]MCS3530135.1 hypothetical protein [Chryseobacterium sp. JUb7]